MSKSLAWLTAVVVVFVPFLVWNIFKVVRQVQAVSAHLRITAESEALADEQMKSFLHNALTDSWYGVAKCYAFGSVVQQYQTRDVDVIVQFNSSKPGRVRTYRSRLRNIESSFQEFHSMDLHLQTFLSDEDEALYRFLDDAGMHERLI